MSTIHIGTVSMCHTTKDFANLLKNFLTCKFLCEIETERYVTFTKGSYIAVDNVLDNEISEDVIHYLFVGVVIEHSRLVVEQVSNLSFAVQKNLFHITCFYVTDSNQSLLSLRAVCYQSIVLREHLHYRLPIDQIINFF